MQPSERKAAATRADKAEQQGRELAPEPPEPASPPRTEPDGASELPRHRVPTEPDGTPKPKAQRNFTDPDSRIMKKGGSYLQGYNAQIAVDAQAQVIVAQAVTNQPPDQEHLVPLLDRVIDNCGQAPDKLSADNGYYSTANVEACEQRGIDAYLAVGRKLDDPKEAPDEASAEKARTVAEQTRQRMREKLQSDAGRAVYKQRKHVAEPPFGQIKEARGFRRFSFRGLPNVRHEWAFVCLTHNLLKLFRSAVSIAGLARV